MDISVTSPRFARFKTSASPDSNNCEVAIDYSKSADRMLPEGRVPIFSSSSSYRVPTKGMRKAYPEDQFHSRNSSQVSHSPSPRAATSEYNTKMDEPYNTLQYQGIHHNNEHHNPFYTNPPPPHSSYNNTEHVEHHRYEFNYDGTPPGEEMKEYQCLKCGIIFSREADLHIHYTQDHGFGQNGGGSSASSSSSVSGNLSSTPNRMQRTPNQEMFCDKCQLRFHCLLSFRVHNHEHVLPNVQPHYPLSNSHLLSLSYTCEICGANFMSRESLTDHANAHLYEHVCSESTCGESDSTATNSSEGYYPQHHYPQQQQQQTRSYMAQPNMNSDSTENSSRQMTHHQHNITHQYEAKADENLIVNQGPNSYTPEYSSSSYQQEISGPVSSSKTGIYEPLVVMENGKRRFKCVVCNKFLSSRIAHEEHTRGKHTGDKPYGCTYCGKRFAVWNTFKHHTSTHKGSKNMDAPIQKCGLCEKRFKTMDCLRTHMQREHNYQGGGGEEGSIGGVEGTEGNSKCPYICQLCGKGFLRKMWRTRHYLSHAGHNNCFRCEVCSCILPDEQSYRMHYESHKVSN